MIFLSYSYHLYVFYVRVVSFSFCAVPAVPPTEGPEERSSFRHRRVPTCLLRLERPCPPDGTPEGTTSSAV